MKKSVLIISAVLVCLISEGQSYRYLKFTAHRTSNFQLKELEWITSQGVQPSPKLTSNNSNGYRAYGDFDTESWRPYDGNAETHAWVGKLDPPLAKSLILDLGAGREIRPDSLRITSPSWSYYYDIRIWASNNEVDWELLLDLKNFNNQGKDVNIFALKEIADTIPPSAPGSPYLLSRTTGSLNISWEPSVDDRGVTSYDVYTDGILSGSTPHSSFLLTGLSEATSYDVYIIARDKAGNASASSDTIEFATKAIDLEAPAIPTGLEISELESERVSFNWNASADNDELAGYLIYLNDLYAGVANDTFFSLPGLKPGESGQIKIIARDISGNNSDYSQSFVFTTPVSEPGNMKVGTNFWNISWGGASNDPFINDHQHVSGNDPWKQAFLDETAFYSHYRFMDWGETNNSSLSHWMDRKQKSEPVQRPMAYEWMIDLCNRQNRDIWITLPHKVVSHNGMEGGDNHFVRKLAILLKTGVDMLDADLSKPEFSNLMELTAYELQSLGGVWRCEPLKPGLRVFIEYSNETWNFLFSQAEYCRQEGILLNLPGDSYAQGRRFHSWAAIRVFEAMEEVFGQDNPRIIKIDAYQSVSVGQISEHLSVYKTALYNPKGIFPDAISPAPYFGGGVNGAASDLKQQLLTGSQGILNVVSDIRSAWLTLKNEIKPGMPKVSIIAYESGQHLLNNAHIASRNPVMYELYVQYLDSLSHYMEELSHYVHSGTYGSGGAWGSKEFIGQTNAEAHKYRALFEWVNGTAIRPDMEDPEPPTGLSASGENEQGFLLQWNPGIDNDTVVQYKVYLNTDLFAVTRDTFLLLTGLNPGRTYRMMVFSVDSAGNTSLPSNFLDVNTTGDPLFSVTFRVVDQHGFSRIAGATILFNGQEMLTDAQGEAIFTSQPSGTQVPWSMNRQGYQSKEGTVDVSGTDPVVVIFTTWPAGMEKQISTVKLYPNPANSEVHYNTSVPFTSFYIMDASGRVLIQDTIQSLSGSISLSGLAGGAYLLVFENGSGKKTETRLIKLP